MQRYILKRVIQGVIALIGVSIIVFLLIRLTGDPVILLLPPSATEEDVVTLTENLGLDKPLYFQYWVFVSGVARGDFGESLRWGRPAMTIFLERLPNTVLLACAAMVWAILVGVSVGILSAVKMGGWFDNFGKIIALVGQATPVFWLGLMLMLAFAVILRWLPTSGMGGLNHLILPSLTLGAYFMAALARLTRSSLLDILDSEYIKMARIKGVPERLVIIKHALRNAMIPVVTLGALQFIFMLNGAVLTETVFNWPGVGRLVVESILARDYPVIQACVFIASCLFVFANLFVDVLYAYLDPRIRYQ